MRDIRETLLSTGYFLDNEYLEKYCVTVERHTRTRCIRGVTNKHHIIPKALFNLLGEEIDNSLVNLVNLPYREHALAHYYLCLCTRDEMKYASEMALICLISRKKMGASDRCLITSMPRYKEIYQDYIGKKTTQYRLYK